MGGVWLKGRYDFRIERERIESARQDTWHALDREDSRTFTERNTARMDERRAEGFATVSDLAEVLSAFSQISDTAEAEEVTVAWNTTHDAPARRAIERIRNPDIRDQMVSIADSLAAFDSLAEDNDIDEFVGWEAKIMIRVLIGLAGCDARDEEPSTDLEQKLDRISELREASVKRSQEQADEKQQAKKKKA